MTNCFGAGDGCTEQPHNHRIRCRSASGSSVEAVLPGKIAHMGVGAVLWLSFFNVSGGPWGSEDIFSSVGPFYGTIGVILFTVAFSLPQCLVTAEMSCMFPCSGGYSVWVREAFGDFWSVQECFWQFVSGVVDCAVYPVLISDAFFQMFDYGFTRNQIWCCRVVLTFGLSLPSSLPTRCTPWLLLVLGVLTLFPVILFVAIGAPLARPSVLMETRENQPLLLTKFVSTLFWNLEGWDCISTTSGMIKNPLERTLWRGLCIGLFVTVIQYIAVLLVAAGISKDTLPWQHWSDGSLPAIGNSLGPAMANCLFMASLAGNAGQYFAEFVEISYLLKGAGEVGVAPKFFAWHCCGSEVPHIANALQFCIVALLVSFDFSAILVFDNCFTALAIALQFAAFLQLRRKRPNAKRLFRVPLYVMVLFVPAMLVIFLIVYQGFAKSIHTFCITCFALSVGVVYGQWVKRAAEKERALGHDLLEELLEDDREELIERDRETSEQQ